MRRATLDKPPTFQLAEPAGGSLILNSDTGAVAHVFVLADDIIRLLVLPDGQLRHPRTWTIAPGEEDVPYEGRDRLDLPGLGVGYGLVASADKIEISTPKLRLTIGLEGLRCTWSQRTAEGWTPMLRGIRPVEEG